MGEYLQLNVCELGREAKRNCTDVWAFVLYSIFFFGMIVFTVFASRTGRPEALLHGVDYNGHICGNFPSPSHLTVSQDEWKTMRFLWYPFIFNSSTNTFTDAIHTGICVKECPFVGDYVWTYGGSITTFTTFKAIYSSSVQLWRCIPDINTLECENNTNCDSRKQMVKSLISDILQSNNFLFGLLRSLIDQWFIHLTMFIFSIIMSFLWAYSMEHMVEPLMVIVSVLFSLLTVVFGFFALCQFNWSSGSFRYVWLSLSILLFTFSVVYTTILIYLRKKIILSCLIIEETNKVVMAIPSMMFVPFLNSLFQGAMWIFFLFATVMLYSHVNMTDERVYGDTGILNVTIMQNSNPCSYVGHLIIFFLCLCSLEIIQATGTLVVALTVNQWYWSKPDGVRTVPFDALLWSIYVSIRYHLGTVILGSLLMTPVALGRLVFCTSSKRQYDCLCSENNLCFSCYAHPFFLRIEAVVRFFSDNAYVVTAITGEPLFSATRQATRLMQRNTSVSSITFPVKFFFLAVKAVIILSSTLLGVMWLLLTVENIEGSQTTIIVTAVFIALVSYFIISLFVDLFVASMDTILLCFCYDQMANDGIDLPFFSWNTLRELIVALSSTPPNRWTIGEYLIQNDGCVTTLR
ncbi:choline transporter-like protein [Trypanosoma theileri]|uniref:Choline transporter-like protein n=1 Tax=Trypanosoma theileri TaxID=67003 RepID=A0A1X0P027_9TRYP|nr:choline transporter-like protein [Trypanosoma theileri]ORC90148.1 choline transporter-like protein [Trypanosoma theileri]